MPNVEMNRIQSRFSVARSAQVTGIRPTSFQSSKDYIPVSKLEFALVVFVLYFATTARVPFVSSVTTDSPGTFVTALRMFGYVISAVLVAGFYKDSLGGAHRILPITTLVVLCGVSTLWSLQPDTTRYQSVVLLGMTAVGVYIGERFNSEDILKLVCITTAVVAFMSIVMLVSSPGLGSIASGPLTGVFVHKNLLGQSMSLGALAWTFFFLSSSRHRFSILLVLSATTLLLIFSNSMTSILGFTIVIALLPLLKHAITGSTRALVMLIAILPMTPFIISTIDHLATALLLDVGRDTSFTGRTDIWWFAIDAIFRQPILGYGFATFWHDPTVLFLTEHKFYWTPATAHNGFLDTALSVGIPGLVLLVWAILTAIRNAIAFANAKQNIAGMFPISALVFFLLYNMFESISGVQPNIIWILLVAILVSTAKWRENNVRTTRPSGRRVDQDF